MRRSHRFAPLGNTGITNTSPQEILNNLLF